MGEERGGGPRRIDRIQEVFAGESGPYGAEAVERRLVPPVDLVLHPTASDDFGALLADPPRPLSSPMLVTIAFDQLDRWGVYGQMIPSSE
jgi:hypothetical protein